MTCESCRELLEVEGIEPECGTCPVPRLSPEGQRILEIRGLLVRLHEVVGSEAILRLHEVTREELGLLALVEEEIKGQDKHEA